MSKRMYHPCHKLSVPSAKLFWCRHCMQMFEDAITRWKHSKQCRGNVGFKPKDQDGQVIQMYVKPDKVSYTTNKLPGQGIVHKAQVKKTSADLKCVICQAKFTSLDGMREHVKYPCHRYQIPSDSEDTDSEESRKEANEATLKIRRVEDNSDNELGTNTSTALAVLAEASKHVESLAHQRGSIVNQEFNQFIHGINEEGLVGVGDGCIQVAPTFTGYQLDELTNQVVRQEEVVITSRRIVADTLIYGIPLANRVDPDETAPTGAVSSGSTLFANTSYHVTMRPFVREDLDPVVISIQAEDGQDIPEVSLDTPVIQSCVRETVETLPLGQVVQVEINNKVKDVRYFTVGCNGTIHPISASDLRLSQLVGATPTHNQASVLREKLTQIEEPVKRQQKISLNSNQNSNLIEVLCGGASNIDTHPAEVDTTVKEEILESAGEIVIEQVLSLSNDKGAEVNQNQSQTNLEHSYQINQASLLTSEPEQNKFQVSAVGNQARSQTFPESSQQQALPPLPQLQLQGQIIPGSLGSLSSIVPVLSQAQKSDLNLQLQLDINLKIPSTAVTRSGIETSSASGNLPVVPIQLIEVPQPSVVVSTESPVVPIDNNATEQLLNNLAYQQYAAQNVRPNLVHLKH